MELLLRVKLSPVYDEVLGLNQQNRNFLLGTQYCTQATWLLTFFGCSKLVMLKGKAKHFLGS